MGGGGGLTWEAGVDGDGYGDATQTTSSCDAPQGYTANGNDCDDNAPSAHPGGVEVCNGADDDCDGTVDGPSSLNAISFYADADGDGYGDAASDVRACDEPEGYVDNDLDCDDDDALSSPDGDEYCDDQDNDCDGETDEDSAIDATTWHADLDGDGYTDRKSTRLNSSHR